MNNNLDYNSLLFFMQTGGTLTPQMIQAAQQLGQLPQLQMGRGMNDINKTNMQEQMHYGGKSMGMFRRGGVPNPSGNKEQETIDQEYMNPDKKYSDRVNNIINKIKQGALNKVQEDMLNTANDYGYEAMEIEDEMMPMAQKGTAYDPQNIKSARAWHEAAKKERTDLVKPMLTTIGLGSGLQGYFGGAEAFAANPLNQYYVKDINVTDNLNRNKVQQGSTYKVHTAQKGKAIPGKDTDEIVRNPDGSITVYDDTTGASTTFPNEQAFTSGYVKSAGSKESSLPNTSIKTESGLATDVVPRTQAELEAEIQAEKDKAKENKTEYTVPTSPNADENPEAGITPGMLPANDYTVKNMRIDYRNNLANVLRRSENKKPGAVKSVSFDFTGTGFPQTAPVEQGPSERQVERQARREDRQINRDDRRQTRADEITQKYQEKINRLLNANPGAATPWDNQTSQSALTPEMIAAMNQDAQKVIPAEGPLSSQERVDNIPNMGYSPQLSTGNANIRQTANYLLSSDRPAELDAYLTDFGYKKGGTIHKFLKKFQTGSENPDDEKRRKDLLKLLQYDPDEYTGNPDSSSSDQIELQDPADLQMQQEPAPTKDKNIEYELGKSNPFFAPAALAGLNLFAGALRDKESKRKEGIARGMLTGDQLFATMPGGLSGAKGYHTFNEGYIEPTKTVPTQFTGYNNPSKFAKAGGGFSTGQEYYLDEDTIQKILAAGGEIEYLD
jgi:hypothetical protein